MTLYKDIYGIIEEYGQIQNIYNFLKNDEKLIYTCDQCDNDFTNICKNNIMSYELDYFNNNILHDKKNTKLGIKGYLLLTNMDIKLCRYKKINKVFCGMCSLQVNKRTTRLNYCDYGLCNNISLKHYNFIRLNNGFFIQDYITDSKAYIKRYSYNFSDNEDVLIINSLFIDDRKDVIESLALTDKFAEIREIIEYTFHINFEYLFKYLKEKTN